MTDDYDLTKSSKLLGQLYPILKDKRGNIIDGFHRQNADPDWTSITIETVDSDVKLELARLATNFCRRILPESEFQQRIAFLIKSGMKPEEIAEQTGISVPTIYRHMPTELKDQKISEGTKQGKSNHTFSLDKPSLTPSDTEKPLTHIEKSNLVSCDHCKIATHISKMRTIDVCPMCFERLTKKMNEKYKEIMK